MPRGDLSVIESEERSATEERTESFEELEEGASLASSSYKREEIEEAFTPPSPLRAKYVPRKQVTDSQSLTMPSHLTSLASVAPSDTTVGLAGRSMSFAEVMHNNVPFEKGSQPVPITASMKAAIIRRKGG